MIPPQTETSPHLYVEAPPKVVEDWANLTEKEE